MPDRHATTYRMHSSDRSVIEHLAAICPRRPGGLLELRDDPGMELFVAFLARSTARRRGLDPKTLQFDGAAAFHALAVVALGHPLEGGFHLLQLNEVSIDFREADIDQKVGQRRVLQIMDLSGEFDITLVIGTQQLLADRVAKFFEARLQRPFQRRQLGAGYGAGHPCLPLDRQLLASSMAHSPYTLVQRRVAFCRPLARHKCRTTATLHFDRQLHGLDRGNGQRHCAPVPMVYACNTAPTVRSGGAFMDRIDSNTECGMAAVPTPSPTFEVKDCALIALATGRKAQNLKELRDHLLAVGTSSIYFHFWGGLLRPGFAEREYANDFAEWTRHGLHDPILAERLGVIDPSDYLDLEDLRWELIDSVEGRLDETELRVWAPIDRQFEFIRSQIVIFPTELHMSDPRELARVVPRLSESSIFYHVIDARRRLSDNSDDFRAWLGAWGDTYAPLCAQLAAVDAYSIGLRQLRDELSAVFAAHFEATGP